MAKRRKPARRKPAKRKKKATRSSSHSLFKIAARDKSFKAAKKRLAKAKLQSKRAWKKATVKAKKKLRKMRYC